DHRWRHPDFPVGQHVLGFEMTATLRKQAVLVDARRKLNRETIRFEHERPGPRHLCHARLRPTIHRKQWTMVARAGWPQALENGPGNGHVEFGDEAVRRNE